MSISDIYDTVTKIEQSEYREANYRALWGANSRTFAEIQEEETALRARLIATLPAGHRLAA